MFTITPITAQQVADLDKKLAVSGTVVNVPDPTKPNDYGIYNAEHKIQATAVYDPTGEGALTVTVTRKPFLVPESMIESGIKEALQG